MDVRQLTAHLPWEYSRDSLKKQAFSNASPVLQAGY